MAVSYQSLKPLVRKFIKNRSQQEVSYEDFVKTSHVIQSKFHFRLPRQKGYIFRDVLIDGCHCIIGGRDGKKYESAAVYLVGGGSRRWQLPSKKTMLRYIDEADRELWIPLYPLYPDHDIRDEVNMILDMHQYMLQKYQAENIAWLGFSAGADLLLAAGRHLVKTQSLLPMPGLMIPVSSCNLKCSEESNQRMKEIEKRDCLFNASMMESLSDWLDHNKDLPEYYWGNAKTDDYTGFPRIRMIFGGDEIFAAEAPAYEEAFRRCKVEDYDIHVEPGMFHAYPMFSFVKEGKQGEDYLLELLKHN